jgi:hypothetical protein
MLTRKRKADDQFATADVCSSESYTSASVSSPPETSFQVLRCDSPGFTFALASILLCRDSAHLLGDRTATLATWDALAAAKGQSTIKSNAARFFIRKQRAKAESSQADLRGLSTHLPIESLHTLPYTERLYFWPEQRLSLEPRNRSCRLGPFLLAGSYIVSSYVSRAKHVVFVSAGLRSLAKSDKLELNSFLHELDGKFGDAAPLVRGGDPVNQSESREVLYQYQLSILVILGRAAQELREFKFFAAADQLSNLFKGAVKKFKGRWSPEELANCHKGVRWFD